MEIQMEAIMANNHTTNKYTLVFKGPVPTHLQNAEIVVVTDLNMGINEVTWLEDEAVGAMDSLDYIDPKHPLLQMKSEDGDDYVLEEAWDFLSNVGGILEYLKPQNCVAIIIESLFTCSRPRPLEHGCYVQAAKLVNGEVKTFGVGGPNVLDMIGD